jgi:predicted CoA-substrate-specific enzyme activase
VEVYLGIDVGSVTTKFAVLDADDELMVSLYLPTEGKPVAMVQKGLRQVSQQMPSGAEIRGVATTGSARYLAGAIVGADLVKNEITCQAVAAIRHVPAVKTVIEIGGQDSKMIIIRDGIVIDFGMNTVCAAGTGSFLDHQAARLNMSIEELSRRAMLGSKPVHIAGRCTVFAESDMVHKQQMGHSVEDIIYGLCQALVRNYLSDVGSGKDIQSPIVFQGGVAFNQGIIRAFGEELDTEIIVPPDHEVMGAIGAALLVHESAAGSRNGSRFKGFGVSDINYQTSSFECRACPALCEIVQVSVDDRVIARWGGRCDMWEGSLIGQGA